MAVLKWFVLCSVALTVSGTPNKVPTVYDVLQLVYQVCSTAESERSPSLACVSSHLGKEVQESLESCTEMSVQAFCMQMTHVTEWAARHSGPPQQLTKVMGLPALGRMACVLGEVQRPLPMWQAAFGKCFLDYQSLTTLKKDNTKRRNQNTLNGNDPK